MGRGVPGVWPLSRFIQHVGRAGAQLSMCVHLGDPVAVGPGLGRPQMGGETCIRVCGSGSCFQAEPVGRRKAGPCGRLGRAGLRGHLGAGRRPGRWEGGERAGLGEVRLYGVPPPASLSPSPAGGRQVGQVRSAGAGELPVCPPAPAEDLLHPGAASPEADRRVQKPGDRGLLQVQWGPSHRAREGARPHPAGTQLLTPSDASWTPDVCCPGPLGSRRASMTSVVAGGGAGGPACTGSRYRQGRTGLWQAWPRHQV